MATIAAAHNGLSPTPCDRPCGLARPAALLKRPGMPYVLARSVLLLLAVLSVGCAFHTQEEKAALARAERLSMLDSGLSDRNVSTGALCAVVPETRMTVTKVDGLPGREFGLPGTDRIFVAPGEHTLGVVVDTGQTVGNSTSHTSGNVTASMGMSARVLMPEVALPFTFEQGKHYRLRHASWGSFEIVLEEITDQAELASIAGGVAQKQAANKEKAGITQSYLAFARDNPRRLEGKWAVGEKEDELEFSDNKVRYVAPKSMFIDTRNTLEGSFVFDQNTIVISWNSFSTFLSTMTSEEHPDFAENMVWHYTLTGDTLLIKRGGYLFPADIGGTYKRVSQDG